MKILSLLLLLVPVAGLSGCATPAPEAPAWSSAESGVYDILDQTNATVGTMHVSFSTLGPLLEVDVDVKATGEPDWMLPEEFPPGEGSYRALINASTGEWIEARSGDERNFFYGTSRFVPSAGNVFMLKNLVSVMAPVGPQWPAWSQPDAGVQWGGVDVSVRWGTGWNVTYRAPCDVQCDFGDTPGRATMVWRMEGEAGEVLPTAAHLHFEGMPWKATLQRTEFTGSHDRGAYVARPPSMPPAPKGQPLCDGFPCDGDDVPEPLRTEGFAAAVRQSPAWQEWTAAQGVPRLDSLVVAEAYQDEGAGIRAVRLGQAYSTWSTSEETKAISGLQARPLGAQAAPWALTDRVREPDRYDPSLDHWGRPIVTMSQALDVAEAHGLLREEVDGAILNAWPVIAIPSPDVQIAWTFVGDIDGQFHAVRVSAIHGTPLQILPLE